MPQFDFTHVFWPQFIWLAIVFSVLFFGVVLPTLPKIGRVVDARENKITGDIDAAATAKTKSDDLMTAYDAANKKAHEDARTAINDAKNAAAISTEKKLIAAAAKVDEHMAKAQAELGVARSKAIAQIEAIATESAADIVEKLSGTRPAAALAATAVKSVLANA